MHFTQLCWEARIVGKKKEPRLREVALFLKERGGSDIKKDTPWNATGRV